jgi:two-component system, cell cycle response regulator
MALSHFIRERRCSIAVLSAGVLCVGGFAAATAGPTSPGSAAGLEIAFNGMAALATLLILLRAVREPAERRAWIALGAAVGSSIVANAAIGWASIGNPGVLAPIGIVGGIAAFPLGICALVWLLKQRVGKLPAIAAIDGLTGAFVVQTVIALALLGPVERELAAQGVFHSLALLYPLADLLAVGVIAAAAAKGGWRLDRWGWLFAAMLAITVGDSALTAAVAGSGFDVGGLANLAWLAGVWLFAVAAWAPTPSRIELPTPHSWVPIALCLSALGLLVGTATAGTSSPLALTMAVCALTLVVARFALTVRQNTSMLLHAREEASTDSLTGLANRRQLTADLALALERSDAASPIALALFDLNGFKNYNDTFGHPAGDALLVTLGKKLARAIGDAGAVYRMGGDEFCILLTARDRNPHELAARAGASLEVGTHGFAVSAAYGLVLMPTEAETASEALRLADLRMYEHKATARTGPRRQASEALTQALEERDPMLHDHLRGVQDLAVGVAERLGHDAAEIERVSVGALLHDVGKIAIPDEILHKPGPLTESEWDLMRQHTLIGERILERAPSLQDIAEIVRGSHECVDGTGYPDGLQGEAIPIAARVVAVCDAYSAMTSARSYRKPLGRDEALQELRRCAGTQFDAVVVGHFTEAVRERDRPAANGDELPGQSWVGLPQRSSP